MRKAIITLIILFTLFEIEPTLAQFGGSKKVLGLPSDFERLVKQVDLTYYDKTIILEKSRKIPWEVYSDRGNNKTSTGKILQFKDNFYVLKENKTQLHIIKAKLSSKLKIVENSIEDFGWIDKEKMLLWSDGLLDSKTKINLKAFLLNNKSSIPEVLKGTLDKERAIIHDSPFIEKATKLDKKRIYQFFYIFKEVQINKSESMYLLGEEVKIRRGNTDALLGWVKSKRITPWNTRFALEPNFEPTAFKERKNNIDNIAVRLFNEAIHATSYGEGKSYKNDGNALNDPIWEDDPVKFSTNQLANKKQITQTTKTDTCRFKGGVIRFPMLEAKTNYFRTAFVGDLNAVDQGQIMGLISDERYADLTDNLNERVAGNNNINVLFVVDGTNGMKQYIKAARESIDEINSFVNNKPDRSIRFGATVYGDMTLNEFEVKPMSKNTNDIIDFLNRVESNTEAIRESTPYESTFYGIQKALNESGLNKDHLNIVVIVGDAGEDSSRNFSANQIDIQKALKAWNAHLLAFNANVTGGRPGANFGSQMKNIILETSKRIYDDYKFLGRFQNYGIKSPELVSDKLQGGISYGSYTDLSNAISIERILIDEVEKAISKADQLIDLLVDFVYNGDAIPKNSAGSLGPAFGKIINNIEFTQEELKDLAFEKYQFYLESYAPKKIKGSNKNCFSYVLFMPERDLKDLIGELNILAGLRNLTSREARKGVIDTWCELLRIYTGESDRQACLSYTPDEISQLIQGVEKEMIAISDGRFSFNKLKKIKNDRTVSDKEVEEYILEVLDKRNILEQIVNLGVAYEFSYTSNNNTYYWIPMEFLP